jgi:hypothetical protein
MIITFKEVNYFCSFGISRPTFRGQGQCKANAIELARFAEPQPVLALLGAKVSKKKSLQCFGTIWYRFGIDLV